MTSSVPYSFVPGTRAMANEVNANFRAVLNNVDELNQQIVKEKENILTTVNQLNEQNLRTDLSNIGEAGQAILDAKADATLTNITFPQDFSQTLNNAGIRTVVETYMYDRSWYRIWSDNWCEQGGSIVVNTNSSLRISLFYSYTHFPYQCSVVMYKDATLPNQSVNVGHLESNGFTIYSASDKGTKIWKTEGYITR